MKDPEVINEMPIRERMDAIEERAALLAGEAAGTNDPETIRRIISELSTLVSTIPPGAPGGSNARERLDAALSAANGYLASAEDMGDEGPELELSNPLGFASKQFQNKVSKFMSQGEQQYFNSLQEGRQYSMATISEDGTVTQTEQTVDGAQLKEDFARVKFHALSEEQQEGIDMPEAKRESTGQSQYQQQQLDRLRSALDRLEGKRASELMERGASKEECRECHEHFEGARDQVDQLKGRIEERDNLIDQGRTQEAQMENAMIQVDKGRLRNTLQKDIIDGELLDNKDRGTQMKISGGQQVDRDMSGQLAAQSVGDALRNSGVTFDR